jgi:hypothetical protein
MAWTVVDSNLDENRKLERLSVCDVDVLSLNLVAGLRGLEPG